MRITLVMLFLALAGLTYADPQVDRLIESTEEPDGVVFEILEDDDDALGWALPMVAKLSRQLRERFPHIQIAVVTHGREQFALLADEADSLLAPIHDQARQLRDAEIDLHVCGTHASWDGYTPEDFPAYIDVSPSGPAQIRDYQNLGFTVIMLQGPDYD